jgi:hypothetical protein
MKLAELLAAMPASLQDEIARHNGWSKGRTDLALRLASPETIDRQYAGLYELERATLARIVRRFAVEPFDWAKLEKAAQWEMSGAALKVGLIRLSHKGIVFALRRKWGETDYVLPEDTFVHWSERLLSMEEAALLYDGADVSANSPYRPSLASRLLAVLACAAKEEVTLTQKGGLHKRHAGRLAVLVAAGDDELPTDGPIPQTYRTHYGSVAVGFVCEIAFRLGLLEKKRERLAVRPQGLARWLRQPEARMHSRLYALWKEAAGRRDVATHHVACCLERLPEGRWISLRKAAEWLDENIGAEPAGAGVGIAAGSDRLERWIGQILQWVAPLVAWGWGETASGPDGEPLFRWVSKPIAMQSDLQMAGHAANAGEGRAAAAFASGLFVQPDFELIVPPDCPYTVRWELEMIAERVRHEHVAVYRLSRETAVRAMEHGRTAEAMLAFLERHAKYGVPDNVRTAILQWGDQQSRLRMEPAVLLRCRDEATARMLAEDERIAPLLAEALGPATWVVRPGKETELRALLERIGYSPGGRKEAAEDQVLYPVVAEEPFDLPAEEDGRDAWGAVASKGLIYSKPTVQYYENERRFPAIEDVYPGLQEIPQMWLKDCRSYHASTRKQMIQKALEWKACLKLRRAGTDTLFIPLRLDGIRDDWAVTGVAQAAEVRLTPDQWEEMQLILPGVND